MTYNVFGGMLNPAELQLQLEQKYDLELEIIHSTNTYYSVVL